MTSPETSRALQQLQGRLWAPHEGGQEKVINSQARFRILRAGRRWGKTETGAHEAIMAALAKDHQMVWWVANSANSLIRGYRKVLEQLPPALLTKPPPSELANTKILHLRNGSKIEFYTAGSAGASASGKDSTALVGEGVDLLVVDEAAKIGELVWYQHLRPTLSDKGGRALIISTPQGRDWFWKLWKRGQLPGADYASWHFTSYDNPIIPDSEVEEARETLPDIVFQQEYLAEFVANAASIFLLPDEQITEATVDPAGWVTLGIDLGKKADFTVISGVNTDTRRPCIYDRWGAIRWPEQQERIIEHLQVLDEDPAVEGYTVAIDSTGLGDVVYDFLEEEGIDVVPINFSAGQGGRQKEKMVRLLAADIEHEEAFILEDMLDEFESYEYQITDTGRWQFEAATGHDDKVSAKLLENWAVVHEAPAGVRSVRVSTKPPRRPKRITDSGYATKPLSADAPGEIAGRPEAWS